MSSDSLPSRLLKRIEPGNTGLAVLAILALACSFITLWWGIDNSIVNVWEFRQAQTGLSAYWISEGGNWLAYETPVSGYPWTIPFEFPTYQWLMALLIEAGIPMNAAGRMVSWVMFAASLVVLWTYMRELGFSQSTRLIFVALIASAPLYLFFSRSIMIESTVLFFSSVYLLSLLRLQSGEHRWTVIIILFASAILAALTKITTFFPFALIGLAQLLYSNGPAIWSAGGWTQRFRRFIAAFGLPGLSIVAALSCLAVWTLYADALKADAGYGSVLTSGALAGWNFGSRSNFLNLETWRDQIAGRSLADLFGSAWVALILLVIAAITRRLLALQAVLIGAFAAAYLVFWNLHVSHDYYQYATGLFLLLAGALAIDGIRAARWPSLPGWAPKLAAIAITFAVMGGQANRFFDHFAWGVRSDQDQSHTAVYALLLNGRVAPENVGVAVGFDWNSILAYESRRRVITAPAFSFWEFEKDPDISAWSGGRPIDVVVDCDQINSPQSRAFVNAAAQGLQGYRFLDCTIFDRVGVAPDIDALRAGFTH